jgi:hypothetical protein
MVMPSSVDPSPSPPQAQAQEGATGGFNKRFHEETL